MRASITALRTAALLAIAVGVATPPASAETPPEVDDDADGFDLGLPEGWYKEPWVIIGAGAAVVVAIGAAVLLSAEDPPPSGPTPEQTVSVGAGYK